MTDDRTAIYARTSTKSQDPTTQINALMEIASRSGWNVIEVFTDFGISGAKGRGERPEFDRLMNSLTRREFNRVAVVNVDRLGRSLQDLVATLGQINSLGVDLYIDKQNIDTSTPAGRALFGMMGVFAEFEREMIRARVVQGLENARRKGKKLGRKGVAPITDKHIAELRATGMSQAKIAKKVGVSQQYVSKSLRALSATITKSVSETKDLFGEKDPNSASQ